MQEVGWAVSRWSGYQGEERCVIMADGALKGAVIESEALDAQPADQPVLGAGGKFALAIMALSVWMLLMTAIYFHTWFEKVSFSADLLQVEYDANPFQLTGLLTAVIGFYSVYIVPRFVPGLRQLIGIPGV